MKDLIGIGNSAVARLYRKASHAQDAAGRLRIAGFSDIRLSEAAGTTTLEHVPSEDGQTEADFTAMLAQAGFETELAHEFSRGIASGGILLTVITSSRANDAIAVLRGENIIGPALAPVDIGVARDRAETAPEPTTSLEAGDNVIPLRAERLDVIKDRVVNEARVRKETVTEHRTIVVPVQREELVIERDGQPDIRLPVTERTPDTPR